MEFYTELNQKVLEIRVVTLLPGTTDDIKCTLQVISLENPPPFEALSYRWGDKNSTKPVTVEGSEMQVTTNLAAALRCLRHKRKPRLLWIDAICINQQDDNDKAYQVPLMGKLYARASAVIAWLGPSTPEMVLAHSWVETYAHKSYGPASKFWLKLEAAAVFSKKVRRKRVIALMNALLGYYQIFLNEYWTRMWTFQEFVLAKEEPLCVCGELRFSAAELNKTRDAIHSKAYALLHTVLDSIEGKKAGDLGDDETVYLRQVADLGKLTRKQGRIHGLTYTDLALVRFDWENKENPLLYFLIATAERQCENPRDNTFALYGVAPGAQDVYPVNYEKEPELVAKETTAYIINHEHALIMYRSFGVRNDRLTNTSYPSWVPNFSLTDEPIHIHPRISATYPSSPDIATEAVEIPKSLQSRGNAPAARTSGDLTTLYLPARNLGVCYVSFRFGNTEKHVLGQIRGMFKTGSGSFPEVSRLGMVRNQETLVKRIARACVAHSSVHPDFTNEELLEGLDRTDKSSAVLGDKIPARQLFERAAEELFGKTMFVTEGGLFGIGVSGIEDGDVLTVPPETKIAIVLRKEPDGADRYRMVGTAMVDGLLEPCSVDDSIVEEVKQLAVETLAIV